MAFQRVRCVPMELHHVLIYAYGAGMWYFSVVVCVGTGYSLDGSKAES
jgi:hypothetical protein